MAKTQIPLPIDVVVAKEFSDSAEATVKLAADVADDDMILDIGPLSQARMAEVMVAAGTILWNGPVGVFEFDAFAGGTRALSNAVAESEGFSVAGVVTRSPLSISLRLLTRCRTSRPVVAPF